MLFDVHVHTKHSSCSALAIEEILLNARSRGVDGVCITDHNTMNVRNDIVEGIQDDGLCVIIGMEYDTPDGDFLLFGPIEDLRPGLDAEEVLHIVSERGGVSIAAHPFRQDRPVAESVMQKGLCRVIEGINGRNSEFENAKTYRWIKKYSLHQCGGSDAHSLEELGTVVTSINTPVRNRRDFINAMNSGSFAPLKNIIDLRAFKEGTSRR